MQTLSKELLDAMKARWVTPSIKVGVRPFGWPDIGHFIDSDLMSWKIVEDVGINAPVCAASPSDGSLIVIDAALRMGNGFLVPTNSEVRITNGGSNYYPLTATITSANGQGAILTVVLSGTHIGSITVVNGGTGYATNDSLVFQGGGSFGSGAAARVAYTANGVISSITITSVGSGYINPGISYMTGQVTTGAVGTLQIINGVIKNCTITSIGSNVPGTVITIVGGDGTATAEVGYANNTTVMHAPGISDLQFVYGSLNCTLQIQISSLSVGGNPDKFKYRTYINATWSDWSAETYCSRSTITISITPVGGELTYTWEFKFGSETGHIIGSRSNILNGAVSTALNGFNDLTVTGTPTRKVGVIYTFMITSTGTPDKFKWLKSGDVVAGIPNPTEDILSDEIECSTTPVLIEDGIYAAFADTSNHVIDTYWQSFVEPMYSGTGSYTIKRFVNGGTGEAFVPVLTGTPVSFDVNGCENVAGGILELGHSVAPGQPSKLITLAMASNPNSQEVVIAAWKYNNGQDSIVKGVYSNRVWGCTFTQNSKTVTVSPGNYGVVDFLTELAPGYMIGAEDTNNNQYPVRFYEIASIESDSSLTLTEEFTDAGGSYMMEYYTGRTSLQVKISNDSGLSWGSWTEIYKGNNWPTVQGNIAIGMNDAGDIGIITNFGCRNYEDTLTYNSISLTRTADVWTVGTELVINTTFKNVLYDSTLGWYLFTTNKLTTIAAGNSFAVDTTPSTTTVSELLTTIQPQQQMNYLPPITEERYKIQHDKYDPHDVYPRVVGTTVVIQRSPASITLPTTGWGLQYDTNKYLLLNARYTHIIEKNGLYKIVRGQAVAYSNSNYSPGAAGGYMGTVAMGASFVFQPAYQCIYYSAFPVEWAVPTAGTGAGSPTLEWTTETGRVIGVDEQVSYGSPGSLTVILRDDDNYFAAPGSDDLSVMTEGALVEYSPGFLVSGTPVRNLASKWFIKNWERGSAPNFSYLVLNCIDAWYLLQNYTFDHPVEWNQVLEAGYPNNEYSIYDMFRMLVEAIGGTLTYRSRSAYIQDQYPPISVHTGDTGIAKWQELEAKVTDRVIWTGNDAEMINPLEDDSSDYEYKF